MAYETASSRWVAISNRDKTAHNAFVYSVKTTGIYCRPTCAARLARRANVGFYRYPAEAEAAGFRPCKRCKPNEQMEGDEQDEIVKRACDVLAQCARNSPTGDDATEKPMGLKTLAERVGKTPRYLHKIFKDRMGVTPKQYAEQMRQLYHPTPTAADNEPPSSSAVAAAAIQEPLDFNDFDIDAFDVGLEIGTPPQVNTFRSLSNPDNGPSPGLISDLDSQISPTAGSTGMPMTPSTIQFESLPQSLIGDLDRTDSIPESPVVKGLDASILESFGLDHSFDPAAAVPEYNLSKDLGSPLSTSSLNWEWALGSTGFQGLQ